MESPKSNIAASTRFSDKDNRVSKLAPFYHDIRSPTFNEFFELAALRILEATKLSHGSIPETYPATRSLLGQPPDSYDGSSPESGTIDELTKTRFLLCHIAERGLPTSFIPIISEVVQKKAVLRHWKRAVPALMSSIDTQVDWIVSEMLRQRPRRMPCPSTCSTWDKDDFIVVPVDYHTNENAQGNAVHLWTLALSEFTRQMYCNRICSRDAEAFLEIYAFLQDPLGGLAGLPSMATDLFVALLARASENQSSSKLNQINWAAAAVQSAKEAMFLVSPLLRGANYLHYTHSQQLPYTTVSLDKLRRSEFSNPKHVCTIMFEILNSQRANTAGYIAPVAVSSYPTLPLSAGKHTTVLIDGNHRVTAVMALRILSEFRDILTTTDAEALSTLSKFCGRQGLGAKWEIDLRDTFQTLRGSMDRRHSLTKMYANKVQHFRNTNAVPALVVREDQFFTVCGQRPSIASRPRVLHPIFQAIYNDDGLNFALPQAGQVHGRAAGYKAMPLAMAGLESHT